MLHDLPRELVEIVLDLTLAPVGTALCLRAASKKFWKVAAPPSIAQWKFTEMWKLCQDAAAEKRAPAETLDDVWARRIRTVRDRRGTVYAKIRATQTKYRQEPRVPYLFSTSMKSSYKVSLTKTYGDLEVSVEMKAMRTTGSVAAIDFVHAPSNSRAKFRRNLDEPTEEWKVTVYSPSQESFDAFVKEMRCSALFDARLPFVRHSTAIVSMCFTGEFALRQGGASFDDVQEILRAFSTKNTETWRALFCAPPPAPKPAPKPALQFWKK